MKNSRIIVLVAGVVVALIAIVIITSTKEVQYAPSGVNNKSGPVVIKHKENIDSKNGKYSVSPEVSGDIQVVDNYIIFWPSQDSGFDESNKYKFVFEGYKTTSGKVIEKLVIEFKVSRNAKYHQLQKEVLEKYGRFEESYNPFLQKLPYTEDYRYKVSYYLDDGEHADGSELHKNKSTKELLGDEKNWREKKNNYMVVIETLVVQGRNDDQASYSAETLQARQEAIDWIRQQGVDEKSDIRYLFMPNDQTLDSSSSSSVDDNAIDY